MQQAITRKPLTGALGRPTDKLLILVGHDTNLANIAGTLNLNWLINGRRDDTPPGGALVFELSESSGSSRHEDRPHYKSESLIQMREAAELTLKEPPGCSNIFIPGCSRGGDGFPCDWE